MGQHNICGRDDRHSAEPEDLLIHEVPDETGYDADVEVLRPDAYEEFDSEQSEVDTTLSESGDNQSEEIVKQMKSLSCNSDGGHEKAAKNGLKRRSKDAFGAAVVPTSTGASDGPIEVVEIADDDNSRSRRKRMRRRSRRPDTARGSLQEWGGILSAVEATSATTIRAHPTKMQDQSKRSQSSTQGHQSEAMDLG